MRIEQKNLRLQEMLAERKDVDKFIFAVDTLFEQFSETEEQ